MDVVTHTGATSVESFLFYLAREFTYPTCLPWFLVSADLCVATPIPSLIFPTRLRPHPMFKVQHRVGPSPPCVQSSDHDHEAVLAEIRVCQVVITIHDRALIGAQF